MQTNNPTRLKDARQSFEQAKLQFAMLDARLKTLETEVGEAKYRISLKDEVDAVIEDIQGRNHQRTVGMYEVLLTQILQEVLQNKDKAIALELGTKAGKPTLDIMVSNDGKQEDIMSGAGGSVANIVSAGLRFIALSRIDCRKFIVLDEADCWLSPDRIAHFANVVSQMGAELGVQSLMISHHDESSFAASATTMIHLEKNDKTGHLSANYQTTVQPVGPKDIAMIELIDFMSHEHTLLKMGPGMTVIHGANDIGKSAVVAALHAISEASFKKEYVRHGCDAGFVRMTLGDGQVIEIQRNVKGSPAIIYRLFDTNGVMAHESPVKSDVPQWAAGLIGIRLEQDLDVQLGNQKTPVFLLAEPDSKKAAILSVGGELSHLVTMQEKYKTWLAADKLKVKEGEAEVGGLRRNLDSISAFLKMESFLTSAEEAFVEAQKLAADEVRLAASIAGLSAGEAKCSAAEKINEIIVPVQVFLIDESKLNSVLSGFRCVGVVAGMALPSISFDDIAVVKTDALSQMIAGLSRVEKLASVNMPEIKLTDLVVEDDRALEAVVSKLLVAEKRKNLMSGFASLEDLLPSNDSALVDEAALTSMISNMRSRAAAGKAAVEMESAAKLAFEASTKEYNDLVASLGGVCPVCHGNMAGEHAHA